MPVVEFAFVCVGFEWPAYFGFDESLGVGDEFSDDRFGFGGDVPLEAVFDVGLCAESQVSSSLLWPEFVFFDWVVADGV